MSCFPSNTKNISLTRCERRLATKVARSCWFPSLARKRSSRCGSSNWAHLGGSIRAKERRKEIPPHPPSRGSYGGTSPHPLPKGEGEHAACAPNAYEALLTSEIFSGIEERQIAGYKGIQLFRRSLGVEVEFVTVLWFESLAAVRTFAGEDYEVAVVPPKP